MLLKDDDEHPVPPEWRDPFREIVRAFLAGDFQLLQHPVERVEPIDASTAQIIADNIEAYGGRLANLSDASWHRSIYRWMASHWEFIVDLSMEDEEVSDLIIHAMLDDAPDARLKVHLVYVP